MKHSADIPIHDIYPIIEVTDTPMYGFLALVVIVLFGIFMAVHIFRNRVRHTVLDERAERLSKLRDIDLNDPKKGAYAICEQGRFFADETPQIHEIYGVLCERLEAYKYAPKVPSIDVETRELYRNFVEMLER
ncbi:MAG TPA: hypothetical protein VFX57_01355 [Sulfuricurvum sp.]|nr:hypothetical protein [Sulfuricurvum sp.]